MRPLHSYSSYGKPQLSRKVSWSVTIYSVNYLVHRLHKTDRAGITKFTKKLYNNLNPYLSSDQIRFNYVKVSSAVSLL